MKRLLILGNYENAIYHNFKEVDNILTTLLQDKFEEVVCSEDFQNLLKLDQDTLLILYPDIWESSITEEQMNALEEYAKTGKILVLHNGISFQNQERFVKLVGAKFLRHPERTMLKLQLHSGEVLQQDEEFQIFEEPYQFAFEENTDIHFFGWYTYQQENYPCCWYRKQNSGKLVYLMPGHEPDIFRNTSYQKLICESIEWLIKE